jgi:hypothetical protein
MALDFIRSEVADSRLTISGGAGGTRVNSSGNIVSASAPRFDYDPVSLAARGLLVEEQRTNSIRNNTMQGAVAGTPGTMPTNWGIGLGANPGTLASTIVGTGTVNGVPYIDIRLFGTPAGTGQVQIQYEAAGAITASSGQAWTVSSYLTLTSTAQTAGVSSYVFAVNERAAGFLQVDTSSALTIGAGSLNTQRLTYSFTVGNASTTNILPMLGVNYTAAAVDITLRIGLPQIELGAFATSVIPTTTAQVTRTADSVTMTGSNFSAWFNASAGTFVVEGSATTGTTPSFAGVDDGSVNNLLRFSFESTKLRLLVLSGGSAVADLNSVAVYTSGATVKMAGAYAANDFAASFNGATPLTDATGAVPVAPDRLRIGSGFGGTGLNGYIRTLRYYPTRLPNAQLQVLTN